MLVRLARPKPEKEILVSKPQTLNGDGGKQATNIEGNFGEQAVVKPQNR